MSTYISTHWAGVIINTIFREPLTSNWRQTNASYSNQGNSAENLEKLKSGIYKRHKICSGPFLKQASVSQIVCVTHVTTMLQLANKKWQRNLAHRFYHLTSPLRVHWVLVFITFCSCKLFLLFSQVCLLLCSSGLKTHCERAIHVRNVHRWFTVTYFAVHRSEHENPILQQNRSDIRQRASVKPEIPPYTSLFVTFLDVLSYVIFFTAEHFSVGWWRRGNVTFCDITSKYWRTNLRVLHSEIRSVFKTLRRLKWFVTHVWLNSAHNWLTYGPRPDVTEAGSSVKRSMLTHCSVLLC